MNGATGTTAGAKHVDQGKVQAASVACASCASLVCGYFVAQESANELLGAAIALAGPVLGWLGGGYYSQRHVTHWDRSGETRAVLRQQNEARAKDPYWQSELRKFASEWESREETRRANALSESTAQRDSGIAAAQEGEPRVVAETTAAELPLQSTSTLVAIQRDASTAAAPEDGGNAGNSVASEEHLGHDGASSSPLPTVDEPNDGLQYDWRGMDDYAILGLSQKDFEGSGLSQTFIAQKMRKAEIEAAHRAQSLVWEPRYNGQADPAECAERLERLDEAKENLVGDKAAQEARRVRRSERRAKRVAVDGQY